jgi:sugar lactone lactonase YvrE
MAEVFNKRPAVSSFTAIALLLIINNVRAQAPTITYNTPTNIYTVGTAITALTPTNTGGAVPATIYGTVTTFAGSATGTAGNTNATGTAASFKTPRWITIDATGTQYVSDVGNNELREITPAAVVTLLAGSATNLSGLTNGTGTAALFNGLYGITNDGAGNLYIADFNNNEIRKVVISTAAVTLLAGSTTGAPGLANGTGTAASFNTPAGIVYDPVSNAFYITDRTNNEIRKMTTTGVVTLFAGNAAGTSGSTNATGAAASFSAPNGIAVDASGNVYVTDQNNNEIRKITPAGVVTLFAGSPTGVSGSTDGTGAAALFSTPRGICVDPSGNIYVTDSGNNTIRMITPAGVVTTIAGIAGTASFVNGVGTAATFNQSRGITLDPTTANLFIADYGNNVIREFIKTGYTISPALLPAGLSFNSATGTISGTPTAAFAAANYTVTAYNVSGSSSAVVSIACGVPVSWTAGSNTTDWATGGNWSTGATPGVNDAVNIGVSAYTNPFEPAITTANVSVGSITFGNNGSGHTLTVSSPRTLTIGDHLSVPAAVTAALTGTGAVNIAPAAIVNITGTGVLTITSPLTFTLKSDATGSASIGQVLATSIAGTGADSIRVERYITGGAGYRGYRLLSSPVYAAAITSTNIYSINYLHDHAFITGTSGATNGFDQAGNPTLYLFREDQTPLNASFTDGNFWGISNITPNSHSTDSYSVTGGAPSTTNSLVMPVGTGLMFFFRGDRTTVNPFVPGTDPVATTVIATGTLNIGQVIVHDWYTPASANLGWTNATANTAVRGFNLVGNPYASSIDWEQYNTTTPTTGIYANNVGPMIYELNPATNNYDTYQKGGAFTNHGTNTIASGQGFFVMATNSTNPQLIFNESAKSTTQNTGLNLFMATRADVASLNSTNTDRHLRLQLAENSIITDDTYIGFDPEASNQYVFNEDAPYKPGAGKVSLASISSDNVTLAINKLPFPRLVQTVIRLDVNATADGIYKLNMTEVQNIPQIFDIWLIDTYKKDSLDMRHNPGYSFNLILADTNSYGSKRFQLVIRQNQALALHLLNFTATKAVNGAQTAWKTENEQGYTNFIVERSTNGVSFGALGGFASSALGAYSYLDTNPPVAADMYRLKMVDLNGTITYSNAVTLMYTNTDNVIASNISVYPNPASSIINLYINQNNNNLSPGLSTLQILSTTPGLTSPQTTTGLQLYGIKIISSTGSVITTATSSQSTWQNNISKLIPGTYIIQVIKNADNTLVGKSTFIKL